MPPALKVCQCHICRVHHTKDPETNQLVQGVLLSRSVWQNHQRAFMIWSKNNNSPDMTVEEQDLMDFEEAVLEATLGVTPDPAPFPNTAPSEDFEMVIDDLEEYGVASGLADSIDPLTTDDPVHVERIQRANRELETRNLEFRRRQAAFRFPELVFDPPNDPGTVQMPSLPFNQNKALYLHQDWLKTLVDQLDLMDTFGNIDIQRQRKALIMEVQEHEAFLDAGIQDAWATRRKVEDPNMPKIYDCSVHTSNFVKLKAMPAPLLGCLITVIALHLIPGLSRDASGFALVAIRAVIATSCVLYVRACGVKGDIPSPIETLRGMWNWPSDIRTAMDQFDLNPNLISFACCPSCYSLYRPKTKDNPRFPEFCRFQAFLGERRCGERLIHPKEVGKPTRALHPYAYQPLDSWLGKLLARPGIAESMKETTSPWGAITNLWKDVFGPKALQEFLGPDGRTPFMAGPKGELRLIFNLNVDWFNPFTNKQAGKNVKIGGIYMVLMNLPTHLRYRIENVYLVGIIPGPGEPPLELLNHLYRPLVDDLLRFWNPGVMFSCTAAQPFGCLVRCALFAIVCDLPAMRKTGGWAAVGSHQLCSFCRLRKSDLSNFNVASWKQWTRQEHVSAAKKWRDAPTREEQEAEFGENSVRWSELLRLPYWDPTRFSVLDAMHNLFLNDLLHHCRDIWGMDHAISPHKTMKPHTQTVQIQQIERTLRAIKSQRWSQMKNIRRGYLAAFVRLNSVHVHTQKLDAKPTKKELGDALIQWRKANPTVPILVPEANPDPVIDLSLAHRKPIILNGPALEQVWADTGKTIRPSWLFSGPKNLGSRSHGKLSADNWRIVCTVNLVITMVRLWGGPNATPRQKALLDNFMALVAAVQLATRRSTSEERIQIIEQQLQIYLKSLVKLFGEESLYPSHHFSLHLPECIRNFGPVHGWWTFPFERYNGIIQRFNSNRKFGQLETTFMKTFCRGGQLKALMSQEGTPDMLNELKPAFHQHFGTEFRGTLLNDLMALGAQGESYQQPIWDLKRNATELSSATYDALLKCINQRTTVGHIFRSFRSAIFLPSIALEPQAQQLRSVKAMGVEFATSTRSLGNAQILYQPSTDRTTTLAGQIQEIFVHKRPDSNGGTITEFFLSVRQYNELSADHALLDPYRKYPLLDVRLCYDSLSPEVTIIRLDQIVSHFASCSFAMEEGIEQSLRVILSLDRS